MHLDESYQIDPKVLGKIILLQSTLHVQNDEVNMARFVSRGLYSVPGIISVSMYIRGRYTGERETPPCSIDEFQEYTGILSGKNTPSRNRSDNSIFNWVEQKKVECIKIETTQQLYGFCLLKISDPGAFSAYKPYIENTINLVALVIENNLQKDELLRVKENLEKTVEERTEKLRYSYVHLDNSFQQLKEEIRERREVEKSLWEAQQILTSAFENSPVGMVLLKTDGYFYQVNKAFCEMIGYSEEEVIRMNFQDFTHPDDRSAGQELFQQILSGSGEKGSLQKRYIHKNGDIIQVQLTTTLLRDDRGEPAYFFTQALNVTEQKMAEEALRQAHDDLEKKVDERTREFREAKEEAEEANRAKSEFLANISHELRNPMHQILSYSKYGIEKIDKPKEKLLHYFNQTKRAADRLMVLVNDLLDLSKMESGRMEYLFETNNLYHIVNEAVMEFKPAIQEKNLVLTVNDPEIRTKTCCDFFKIGQVIRNLLSNAIKFSVEQTQIEISFKQCSIVRDDGSVQGVQVSIRDQGIGIPDQELTDIFEKFTQSTKTKTGAGGTGLGLAICREIIRAHQGAIWAENNPDGGAIFSFCLALADNGS